MMQQYLPNMLFVLDLDDTLYLERDYVRSGFHAIDRWLLDNRNKAGFFERAWRLFEQGIRGNIFDLVLADLNIIEKGLIEHFIKLYRNHIPDITLLPDAITFFQIKKREDLALITDGYSIAQHAKIEALGIKQYLDKIIVTDDWGGEFWKPHPRAFIEAQGNYAPEKCIYISDNPQKDFISPEKLGWAPSIRIRRENSLHYAIETPEGCYEVSKLTEISC